MQFDYWNFVNNRNQEYNEKKILELWLLETSNYVTIEYDQLINIIMSTVNDENTRNTNRE